MSDRAALLSLAARCEAATGPDRELDVSIARAVDPDRYLGHASGLPDDLLTGDFSPTPRFTRSIDAALTLVPEGWFVAALSEAEGDPLSGAQLTRWKGEHASAMGSCGVNDIPVVQQLALALCAAALRARAMEVGNGE